MEQVIKALIKKEIINSILMEGLSNLGIDASPYYLNISETILTIVEVKMNDDEFDTFDNLFSSNIDIEDTKSINKLTDKIYKYLMKLKV